MKHRDGDLEPFVICGKCGGKIVILGRTGGGSIAVDHRCTKNPHPRPKPEPKR